MAAFTWRTNEENIKIIKIIAIKQGITANRLLEDAITYYALNNAELKDLVFKSVKTSNE